jgi:hypothetical protein
LGKKVPILKGREKTGLVPRSMARCRGLKLEHTRSSGRKHGSLTICWNGGHRVQGRHRSDPKGPPAVGRRRVQAEGVRSRSAPLLPGRFTFQQSGPPRRASIEIYGALNSLAGPPDLFLSYEATEGCDKLRHPDPPPEEAYAQDSIILTHLSERRSMVLKSWI